MTRWITDRLGTDAWSPAEATADLAYVDVRDLVDKHGNTPAAVKAKIDEALNHLAAGKRVVVRCDYGISRSNAVAAGVLARYDAIGLDEAVRRVVEATGESGIKIEVLTEVRSALGESKSVDRSGNVTRRLLVTGGTGFIGSAVVPRLQQSCEVFCPTREQIDIARGTVLLDMMAKEQAIDTVLHLANPRIYSINESMGPALVMLKNVLDACLENDLFLVYLSGWEIYSGYRTRELRADESTPARPGNTYGITKLMSEELIEHYRRHHGLLCTTLRSSPVYGPGSDRPKFISNFVRKALRDELIVTHQYINGFPALDLLHLSDLAEAIQSALGERPDTTINLGSGVGTSTAAVAQMIVEITDSRSRIEHREIAEYAGNIVMDTGRATSLLGWRSRIELRRGLETLVQSAAAIRE